MSVDNLLNQALSFHQTGQLDKAEELYRKLLSIAPRHANALHLLGLVAYRKGRLELAIDMISQALAVKPDFAEAHSNLGLVYQKQGRLDAAVACYEQALAVNPGYANALSNLGNALLAQEKRGEAITRYEQAVAIRPDFAEALYNLGNALTDIGRLDDAILRYKQALAVEPTFVEALSNLGFVLQGQGKLREAIACYEQALTIKPDFAEALFGLGMVLQDQEKTDEAMVYFKHAIAFRPDYAEALYNLGNAYQALGKMDEAIDCHKRAIAIKPDFAEALSHLGIAFQEKNEMDKAIDCYKKALAIKPDFAEALSNLGLALQDQGKPDEAIAYYEQAIAIKPDFEVAHYNLGNALKALGKMDEAVARYKQALAIKPDFEGAHSNLIFALDFSGSEDIVSLAAERRAWGAKFAAPLYHRHTYGNVVDGRRLLRIGYVSADFRDHSAAKIFGGMLLDFDRQNFEVFAYSNNVLEDITTRRFQKSVTRWRQINGQSDEAVADRIRQDKIDILVDLSGHSGGNRLLVFTHKPAPVQVTAWGHATSTGIETIDAFFTDSVLVPPEEKHLYVETVRYLPNAVCFTSDEALPPVSPLPALQNNFVTFGCFNRLCKLSEPTFSLWVKILQSVPASRLILKSGEFDDAAIRTRVSERFTGTGIDAERIRLQGKTSWYEHMDAFSQVDIALDPFPHGGGVTTLEGLLMGVPVVTLRWPSITGRLSASILTSLGLTDWIAESAEQYFQLAVGKAGDMVAHADLRAGLRERFQSSPVGDSKAYLKAVEAEYRKLWLSWVDSQTK